MAKLIKLFFSRTVWTIIVMVIINGIPSVESMIPVSWLPYIDGVLGLLAIYFRINPKQNY